MKKLAAIFFLLVVVFNLYGYRLLISYLQSAQTIHIEKQLDRLEYNDEDLISIKTILHLPYYSSSPEFERAYGSITVNGISYEYVKKRVYNDTLEVLCLPNHHKSKLQQLSNDITRMTADSDASTPGGKNLVIKISLPEYCNALTVFTATVLSKHTITNKVLNSSVFPSGYLTVPELPPQSIHV